MILGTKFMNDNYLFLCVLLYFPPFLYWPGIIVIKMVSFSWLVISSLLLFRWWEQMFSFRTESHWNCQGIRAVSSAPHCTSITANGRSALTEHGAEEAPWKTHQEYSTPLPFCGIRGQWVPYYGGWPTCQQANPLKGYNLSPLALPTWAITNVCTRAIWPLNAAWKWFCLENILPPGH